MFGRKTRRSSGASLEAGGAALAAAIHKARVGSSASPEVRDQRGVLFRPTFPISADREVAISDQLADLARLHESGQLTDQEFDRAKRRLLDA